MLNVEKCLLTSSSVTFKTSRFLHFFYVLKRKCHVSTRTRLAACFLMLFWFFCCCMISYRSITLPVRDMGMWRRQWKKRKKGALVKENGKMEHSDLSLANYEHVRMKFLWRILGTLSWMLLFYYNSHLRDICRSLRSPNRSLSLSSNTLRFNFFVWVIFRRDFISTRQSGIHM